MAGIPAVDAEDRIKGVTDRFFGTGPRRALVILVTAASLLAGSARWQSSHSTQPLEPKELIGASGFRAGDVGYILLEVHSGRILAENAPDEEFMPASVAKLVTCYAAEQILGADYRFSTRLFRRGADLYLEGGGDPVLTADDLNTLVMQLQAAGTGGVARFYYDDTLMPVLPEIDPGQPEAALYNAGLGALNVDFNAIQVTWSRANGNGRLEFQARSVADGMTVPTGWISFEPAPGNLPPGALFIHAGSATTDRWQYARQMPDHGTIFLPVKNASLHAASVFREVASLAGVELPAPQAGLVPAGSIEVGRIDSPPLAEIIAGLLHYSNNMSAELLGLAAARKLTGRSLSLAQSSQALAAWLQSRAPGADWRGMRLENNSGFSAKSRISPRQMAEILALIAADPPLMDNLHPLRIDGSPKASASGDAAPGAAGKSGTMDYASGLAGYLPTAGGQRLAFAIFVFDRQRRAALDARMDPRVLDPPPETRDWGRRARALEDALLKMWVTRY
jgi:serine-type D-Ala-D-Ala carboxypeptidase/endopeptidase (penicillin-binding protein 4)